MSGPFLTDQHQARVYDRLTGEVHTWSVPSAIENVSRNPERYGHGNQCPAGERIKKDPTEGKVTGEVSPPALKATDEDGTLDMPQAPDPQLEMLREATAVLRAERDTLVVERDTARGEVSRLRELIQEYETDLLNAKAQIEGMHAQLGQTGFDAEVVERLVTDSPVKPAVDLEKMQALMDPPIPHVAAPAPVETPAPQAVGGDAAAGDKVQSAGEEPVTQPLAANPTAKRPARKPARRKPAARKARATK